MTTPYDHQPPTPQSGAPYVYDGHVPQGGAQPQPAPAKERNVAGIIAGSVLGAIVVVVGGLTVFQQVRDVAPGPLGWDDNEVKSYFEAGALKTCNLGEDFYDSVGMYGVDWSVGGCTGLVDSEEGFPFSVTIDPQNREGGEFAPDIHHHNWMYREGPMPATLEEVPYATVRGAECVMVSNREEYENVSITVDGPCEAVWPLVDQLDNLADQYAFASGNRRRFNFSAPEYRLVGSGQVSSVSDVYRQALGIALLPGQTVVVPEDDFEGSLFTFTDAWFEGDTLRYEAEFTLGEKYFPGRSTFDLPSEFVAMYPNGDQIALLNDASFSLDVGATETFTGDSERAWYQWEEFVIIATNTDGEKVAWVFGG